MTGLSSEVRADADWPTRACSYEGVTFSVLKTARALVPLDERLALYIRTAGFRVCLHSMSVEFVSGANVSLRR